MKTKKSTNPPSMALTSQADEVNLILAGTGSASIDWGDGSELQHVTLVASLEEWRDIVLTQAYSDGYSHTIKITGENITHFTCCMNELTDLDVTQNQKLIDLVCCNNFLTTLNLSNNPALHFINCSDNHLSSLNVSNNPALKCICAYTNYLTTLDVSKSKELEVLDCDFNDITKLDLTNNTNLKLLYLDENQLDTNALNCLLESLNDDATEGKTINITDNPGTPNCDRTIATQKGWLVPEPPSC